MDALERISQNMGRETIDLTAGCDLESWIRHCMYCKLPVGPLLGRS